MLLPLAACLFSLIAGVPETNPHDGPPLNPARIFTYEKQELTVENFAAEGRILDIGGGGEGVIGRLKGAQVVAIDLYAWGMRRNPDGPLKTVMDATDLKFLENSFGTVTSFFTLMYMTPEQQQKSLQEAFRVLKPGGRMLIWDVDLPVSPDPKKDVAVFPFVFHLPAERVETGYGTKFPAKPMGLEHYKRLALAAGFETEAMQTSGNTIYLCLKKR